VVYKRVKRKSLGVVILYNRESGFWICSVKQDNCRGCRDIAARENPVLPVLLVVERKEAVSCEGDPE
jgi:hypothetical protein